MFKEKQAGQCGWSRGNKLVNDKKCVNWRENTGGGGRADHSGPWKLLCVLWILF